MNTNEIFEALALPSKSLQDARIPKTVLQENLKQARVKRLVDERVDELRWIASLNPQTAGVAPHLSLKRNYQEINVLHLRVRDGAKLGNLPKHIHQAVSFPIVLVTENASEVAISTGHIRPSQAEDNAVVFEEDTFLSAFTENIPLTIQEAFAKTLAVNAQPQHDLLSMYEGFCASLEAVIIAQHTGVFKLEADNLSRVDRREAFAKTQELEAEIQKIGKAIKATRAPAKIGELNVSYQRLRKELKKLNEQLQS